MAKSKVIENLQKRIENITDEKPTIAEQIVTRESRVLNVKASELRECINANPDHPVAKVYAKAVQRYGNDEPLAVDAVDIESLIGGHEVQTEEVVENGQKFLRKSVKKAEQPVTPPSSPTPPPPPGSPPVVIEGSPVPEE
jgi:hypothetical protein